VTDYLQQLVAAYPCIQEVWLFGSRANGTPKLASDWDFLVWSDDDRLLSRLCQDDRFHRTGFDLFVVVDRRAAQPWPAHDGQHKQFWLDHSPGGFHWRKVGPTEARYLETKDRSRGSFATDCRERIARRVDPRPGGSSA